MSEKQVKPSICQAEVPGDCQRCKKRVSTICARCCNRSFLTKPFETYYCSEHCQKQDLQNHQAKCADLLARKQIYRAAEIVRQLYCWYRRKTYDLIIEKVDSKPECLTLFVKTAPNVCFAPIPLEMLGNPDDQRTALTYGASIEEMQNCYQWFYRLLEGLPIRAAEYVTKVRSCPRTLKVYHDDHTPPKTNDVNIVSRVWYKQNAEIRAFSYVFDLGGEQYGYKNYLDDADAYWHNRDVSIGKFHAFNKDKPIFEPTCVSVRPNAIRAHLLYTVTAGVQISICDMTDSGQTSLDLLSLPDEEYSIARKSLVRKAVDYMTVYLAAMHERDAFLTQNSLMQSIFTLKSCHTKNTPAELRAAGMAKEAVQLTALESFKNSPQFVKPASLDGEPPGKPAKKLQASIFQMKDFPANAERMILQPLPLTYVPPKSIPTAVGYQLRKGPQRLSRKREVLRFAVTTPALGVEGSAKRCKELRTIKRAAIAKPTARNKSHNAELIKQTADIVAQQKEMWKNGEELRFTMKDPLNPRDKGIAWKMIDGEVQMVQQDGEGWFEGKGEIVAQTLFKIDEHGGCEQVSASGKAKAGEQSKSRFAKMGDGKAGDANKVMTASPKKVKDMASKGEKTTNKNHPSGSSQRQLSVFSQSGQKSSSKAGAATLGQAEAISLSKVKAGELSKIQTSDSDKDKATTSGKTEALELKKVKVTGSSKIDITKQSKSRTSGLSKLDTAWRSIAENKDYEKTKAMGQSQAPSAQAQNSSNAQAKGVIKPQSKANTESEGKIKSKIQDNDTSKSRTDGTTMAQANNAVKPLADGDRKKRAKSSVADQIVTSSTASTNVGSQVEAIRSCKDQAHGTSKLLANVATTLQASTTSTMQTATPSTASTTNVPTTGQKRRKHDDCM